MNGELTLRTWTDTITITDVTDVKVDGRDLLVDGPAGTKRIPGTSFAAWSFVVRRGSAYEIASGGVGYAHCSDLATA